MLFHIQGVTVLATRTGRQKQTPVVAELKKAAADKIASADRISDKVAFEKVEGEADFVYSLTGSVVKEEVIIKEKADVYCYSFLPRCENVAAEFDEEEKRVAFKDTESGDEVFHIPAPFMGDADGNISAEVTYDVRVLDGGDMLLIMTADSEWINAESRAFPVVIDPQIRVSGTSAMGTYSWTGGIMSLASTHTVATNCNCNSSCNASRMYMYMYMKLNMPTLPRNPRIKKAELKLF